MKLVVPLLSAVTLFTVAFVLVELRAPLTPASSGSAPPAPRSANSPSLAAAPSAAPPVAAPPVAAPSAAPPPPPPTAAPPVAPSTDPLDVVVRGKTRREWHAYYAERQQQAVAEIARHQALVDRVVAGAEPDDPRDVMVAHDRIRELNAQIKEDLEQLQLIDANP